MYWLYPFAEQAGIPIISSAAPLLTFLVVLAWAECYNDKQFLSVIWPGICLIWKWLFGGDQLQLLHRDLAPSQVFRKSDSTTCPYDHWIVFTYSVIFIPCIVSFNFGVFICTHWSLNGVLYFLLPFIPSWYFSVCILKIYNKASPLKYACVYCSNIILIMNGCCVFVIYLTVFCLF